MISGVSGDPYSLGKWIAANAGEVSDVSIPSEGQERSCTLIDCEVHGKMAALGE